MLYLILIAQADIALIQIRFINIPDKRLVNRNFKLHTLFCSAFKYSSFTSCHPSECEYTASGVAECKACLYIPCAYVMSGIFYLHTTFYTPCSVIIFSDSDICSVRHHMKRFKCHKVHIPYHSRSRIPSGVRTLIYSLHNNLVFTLMHIFRDVSIKCRITVLPLTYRSFVDIHSRIHVHCPKTHNKFLA